MTELDEMLFYLDSLIDNAQQNPYTKYYVLRDTGETEVIHNEKDEIKLLRKIKKKLKGAK